ncbi:hypothetical protein HOF65_08030 [bacterium]|nr:hypothetical protein [bacterium]MBT3853840.1 hypothetical protein [bacterium]MBT4632857.1 hypothetical protein [bacterium]MBT6779236.1 hypothetical protein [bacterium]
MSLECSQIEGSSRTYIIHSNFVQICVANLILCASHHDKVHAFLEIVIYVSHTPARNSSLSREFFSTFLDIFS